MFLELGACPPRDLKKPGELRSGSEVKSAWSIPLNALKPKSGTPSSQTPSSWFFLSRWHSSHFSCCDLARFRAAVPPKKPYFGGGHSAPKRAFWSGTRDCASPCFLRGNGVTKLCEIAAAKMAAVLSREKRDVSVFSGHLQGTHAEGLRLHPCQHVQVGDREGPCLALWRAAASLSRRY